MNRVHSLQGAPSQPYRTAYGTQQPGYVQPGITTTTTGPTLTEKVTGEAEALIFNAFALSIAITFRWHVATHVLAIPHSPPLAFNPRVKTHAPPLSRPQEPSPAPPPP